VTVGNESVDAIEVFGELLEFADSTPGYGDYLVVRVDERATVFIHLPSVRDIVDVGDRRVVVELQDGLEIAFDALVTGSAPRPHSAPPC